MSGARFGYVDPDTCQVSGRSSRARRSASAAVVATLAIIGAIGAHCATVNAADYPVRAVRLVVPFAPGGATDILARVIAPTLASTWGQSVLVDNRPGAGGAIGGTLVAKANPDGHTLFVPSGTLLTANPFLYSRLAYQPARDLAPITILASNPQVIVVSPTLAVKTVKELIALAKSRPAGVTFASAGIGSQTHLGAESFAFVAGIDATHVPYSSGGQANAAVLSGEVQFAAVSISTIMGQIGQGKLRPIAVTSRARARQAPEIPTVADTLPGFDNLGWFALMSTAGTPAAIVQRIYQDCARILKLPDVQTRLDQLGMDPIASTPEAFAKEIARESKMWAALIDARKLRAE
ncbi:MAG: tripartite tricarboxylate transporter substrate binding protein [Proteobacteria bacterium]|nr:tripartite tricarboxylate transporter substrate binding protein [Burkholderiales bacterium]